MSNLGLAPYEKLYFNKIYIELVKQNKFNISKEDLLKEYPILDKTEIYYMRKFLIMYESEKIKRMAYKISHIKDYVYLKVGDEKYIVDETTKELADQSIISINDIASYFEVPYWIGLKIYQLVNKIKEKKII